MSNKYKTVSVLPAPAAATNHVQIQTPGSERENEAFGNLNNAVLQLFDRTFDTKHTKGQNANEMAEQMRIRAAQVVESLKIHVRDELDALQREEIGQLKLRERKLMDNLAAEQQKGKAQQHQLDALRNALEDIKRMHAEEMSSRQADFAKHSKEAMDGIKADHAAEIQRMRGMIKLAGQTASSIGSKVENLKAHYAQSEAYHSQQVNKLQSEIDAHRAVGNEAEASARLAYLAYHQQELAKTRGIVAVAASSATSMESAISTLKEQYAAELEASKAMYAEKVAREAEALRSEYQAELKRLKAALAQKEGELADTLGRQNATAAATLELEAIKEQHTATLAKLKEDHRAEIYFIQAKQQKLQKELSLRLDPLNLSSQDSVAKGTLKRSRMEGGGRTLTRATAIQDPPKQEDPFAAAQEELMRQMEDIDEHYEEMDAKRGKIDDYPRRG